MFRFVFMAGLFCRETAISRVFLLLVFCWITMSGHSATYITEVSTTGNNAYVEIFNSADTTAMLCGWKMQCGSVVYEFGARDKIAAESVLVVDLKSSFLEKGNAILILDSDDDIIDRFVIGNLGLVRTGESYQRDTVAVLSERMVKEDESPIHLEKCTKGYFLQLVEVDRNTIKYWNDPVNPQISYGTFPVKDFSVPLQKDSPSKESFVSEQHLYVSPNPCQTTLTVIYTRQEPSHYQLTDAVGRVVVEGDMEGKETVDMSRYVAGIYMLTVGEETIKVEKK